MWSLGPKLWVSRRCMGVGSGSSKELALKAAGHINVLPFWTPAIARGKVLVKRCDRESQWWLKCCYNDNSGSWHLEFPSVKIISGHLRSRPTHSCALHSTAKTDAWTLHLGTNAGSFLVLTVFFCIFSHRKKKSNHNFQDISWQNTNSHVGAP